MNAKGLAPLMERAADEIVLLTRQRDYWQDLALKLITEMGREHDQDEATVESVQYLARFVAPR